MFAKALSKFQDRTNRLKPLDKEMLPGEAYCALHRLPVAYTLLSYTVLRCSSVKKSAGEASSPTMEVALRMLIYPYDEGRRFGKASQGPMGDEYDAADCQERPNPLPMVEHWH